MIRKINLSDISTKLTSKRTNYPWIESDIKKFMKSDWEAAEIDTRRWYQPCNAQGSYKKTLQRLNLDSDIFIINRKGRIYMIKSKFIV